MGNKCSPQIRMSAEELLAQLEKKKKKSNSAHFGLHLVSNSTAVSTPERNDNQSLRLLLRIPRLQNYDSFKQFVPN